MRDLLRPIAAILLGVALFIFPQSGFSASTLQYSWNMDTNPGWTTEGLWAFGVPQGLGGGEFEGGPDPTSGHTGSFVYGYNLSGNYEPDLPAKYLTTGTIDCSGLSNVVLKFWLWLGVEAYDPPFGDHADVEVSNDGSTWYTIQNNYLTEYADTAWHQVQLPISTYADGQSTVKIRWAMGPTDSSLNFCGFNIDDVEIWAEAAYSLPTATTGSASSVSSNSAILNGTVNPGGAATTVLFDYGTTTQYGSTVPASQSPLNGTTSQAVSALISRLASNKTYHFRVRASNAAGSATGGDRSFSTGSKCPECSGTVVNLTNVTFPSGLQCQCNATVSITLGNNVTVESGGNVTFSAPRVTVTNGFHAKSGSTVRIKR